MPSRAVILFFCAVLCVVLGWGQSTWSGIVRDRDCVEGDGGWKMPNGIRAITATYCSKSQAEALSWAKAQGMESWAACPRDIAFSPLGNLHPLKAVVLGYYRPVSSGEIDNLDLLEELARKVHKYHPRTPINITITRAFLRDEALRSRISARFDKPPLSEVVSFQPTGASETGWMRDMMLQGVRGIPPRAVLLPSPRPLMTSIDVVQDLARSCEFEAGKYMDLPDEHEVSGNQGGNIMSFPGGVTVIGNTMQPEWRASLFFDKDAGKTKSEAVEEIQTDWLEVGHADEIVSVMPSSVRKAPCNFSIAYASPKLGVQTLQSALARDPDRSVDPRFPARIQTFVDPLDARKDAALFPCILALNLKRDDNESLTARDLASCPELARANLGYDEAIVKQVERIRAKVALRTGCPSPPLVAVPQLFLPSTTQAQYPSPLDQARALNPNAVNAMVLGKTVIAPAQSHPAFAEAVKSAYSTAGMTADSIDTGMYHRASGEIHCGTNELRSCDPTPRPY